MRTRKLRLLSAFLALAMMLTLLPTAAFAEGEDKTYTDQYGTWTYAENTDGTATISYYTGSASNVNIPGTIDGKKVTCIESDAFVLCYSWNNVEIPDSVTSIGNRAFFYLSNLTSINIPVCVTSIGDNVFLGCTRLTDVKYDGTKSQWDAIWTNPNSCTTGNDAIRNNVKYLCKVNFDLNGGTINENIVQGQTVYTGKALGEATCYGTDKKFEIPSATPTREHYTFDGWYVNDTKVEKIADYTPKGEDIKDDAVTFTARWIPDKYKVILNDDANATEYGYDTLVTIDAPAADSKTHYTFTGWKVVEPAGLETATNEKDKSLSFVMPASDVKLKAQWDPNSYTVTFEDKDHDTKTPEQTVLYGGTAAKPADPKTAGYTFAGWYTDEACTNGNEFDFNKTAITKNTTLYAMWTPKYDLKATYFDVDVKDPAHVTVEPLVDGVGEITIKYYDENNKLVTDENGNAKAPTEPGTYTVKLDVTEGDAYLAAADLTDTKWTFTIAKKPDPEPVTYTVTVENGTAYDGDTAKNNFKQGETVTIKVNEEALKEMDFDKWEVVKGDVTLKDEFSPETTFEMPTENVELKAVLKAKAPEEPKEMKPNPASVAVGAGVAVVGGAVLGYTGYLMARELFATAILPAGAALPTNKAELAALLWKQAEQPAVETATDFADIADADTQSAVQWAVANGLMSAEEDGTFAPEKSVSLMEVYRALKAEKALTK